MTLTQLLHGTHKSPINYNTEVLNPRLLTGEKKMYIYNVDLETRRVLYNKCSSNLMS